MKKYQITAIAAGVGLAGIYWLLSGDQLPAPAPESRQESAAGAARTGSAAVNSYVTNSASANTGTHASANNRTNSDAGIYPVAGSPYPASTAAGNRQDSGSQSGQRDHNGRVAASDPTRTTYGRNRAEIARLAAGDLDQQQANTLAGVLVADGSEKSLQAVLDALIEAEQRGDSVYSELLLAKLGSLQSAAGIEPLLSLLSDPDGEQINLGSQTLSQLSNILRGLPDQRELALQTEQFGRQNPNAELDFITNNNGVMLTRQVEQAFSQGDYAGAERGLQQLIGLQDSSSVVGLMKLTAAKLIPTGQLADAAQQLTATTGDIQIKQQLIAVLTRANSSEPQKMVAAAGIVGFGPKTARHVFGKYQPRDDEPALSDYISDHL